MARKDNPDFRLLTLILFTWFTIQNFSAGSEYFIFF